VITGERLLKQAVRPSKAARPVIPDCRPVDNFLIVD
jgi:hypothetical protein